MCIFTMQIDRKVGGRTALHCAAVTSNIELVKLLLEFSAGKEMEVGHLKLSRVALIVVT